MKRRNLVRLLVGLGIGIPILVEAITFLGLVENQLTDGSGSPTRTTEPDDRVGIGDELLPETTPREILQEAVVDASTDRWLFRIGIDIENTAETEYELRLENATTSNGSVVTGGGSSGTIPPGETASLTGSWILPKGETPDAVDVTGIIDPAGAAEATTERVRLAKVPVRGA